MSALDAPGRVQCQRAQARGTSRQRHHRHIEGAGGASYCAPSSHTIVFIVCDAGWKYLSTGAWTDDLDEVVERAKKIIYF